MFGGSQGARSINNSALNAEPYLRRAGIQVIHVIGPKNTVEVEPPPGDPQYVILPYIDRMDLAYAAADLVLCRSGGDDLRRAVRRGPAGRLCAAAPRQRRAAPERRADRARGRRPDGGGRRALPEWIMRTLAPLLHDPNRIAAMSEAAARMGRKDADVTLARKVLEIAAR